MCGGHHEARGHGRRRGFGRRGFPDREVWVERLRDYEQQLETELANVKDVIERLAAGDAPEQPGTA
jgi:ribosomal protein L19E